MTGTRRNGEWAIRTLVLTGFAILALYFLAGGVARCLRGDTLAPVDSVQSEWLARLAITNNVPTLEIDLTACVLRAGLRHPARIPLFPEQTIFMGATIDGKPFVPVKHGGFYHAETWRPGSRRISVRLDVHPRYEGGDFLLSLPRPSFVKSSISVASDAVLEVRVLGGRTKIVGRKGAGTRGAMAIDCAGDITVLWRAPRPDVTRAGLVSVRPSTAWKIGERTLSASMLLDAEVLGGTTDRLSLGLPVGADNVRISGTHPHESRRNGDELTVYFKQQLSGRTTLKLSFDIPRVVGETLSLPAVDVVEGRVEPGGHLLVFNDAPGILLENRTDGLKPFSDLDLPSAVLGMQSGTPLFIYECVDRAARPSFDLVTRTPFPLVDTLADRVDMIAVIRPGGDEIVRIRLRIRNNARQHLRTILPAGATVISAEVDHAAVTLSDDGGSILVPLAKSIQTLGGLVPFPVELTYCRKGAPVLADTCRTVDLPEFPDVPAAVVNVMVLYPEDAGIRSCTSKLRRVEKFSSPDDGVFYTDAGTFHGADARSLLTFNYYDAGYRAYRANNLEQAEKYLAGVGTTAPGSPLRKLADDLLGNIRLARGEAKAKEEKLDRAKASQIRKSIGADNSAMEAQQATLVESGLKTIQQGDQELGVEFLEMADELGRQIVARGGSKERQTAIRRQYGSALEATKKERETMEQLEKKVAVMQNQALSMARSGKSDSESREKAGRLAGALARAQYSGKMNAIEVQNAVFGDVMNNNAQPGGEVSKKAMARQYGRDVNYLKNASQQGAQRVDLLLKNAELTKQAAVLEQVLAEAKNAPAEPKRSSWSAVGGLEEIVGQARKVRDKLGNLLDSISARRRAGVSVDDAETVNEFKQLAGWNDANMNVYGQMDSSLQKEFQANQAKIAAVRGEMDASRNDVAKAPVVAVELGGPVRENMASAMAVFLGTNYFAAPWAASTNLIQADKGRLVVANGMGAPEMVQEIVDKFKHNDGQVVTVDGMKIPARSIRNSSLAEGWMSGRSSNGTRYGVLDEAQYNTLVTLADSAGAAEVARESRETVVGTSNRVAGQSFTLARSDSEANGILVGDSQIDLPHDRYLVLDNGDDLLLLRAGSVHSWLDRGQAKVSAPASLKTELPQAGVQLRFEKTLLGAGESADIELAM